jgi:cytochrome c
MRIPIIVGIAAFVLNGCSSNRSDPQSKSQVRVLVFSKTAGYRHASIPDGILAIQQLGAANGFVVDASDDASVSNDATLASYQAIIFLNTTGEILNAAQQGALQRYIRAGGGFVGIHSASDTEHSWPWYGGLVGAFFLSHPAVQNANLNIEDLMNPSTFFLPSTWQRTDEWYNFDHNPRGVVCVLATVDESTYSGGTMGPDHPIAWCQIFDGGRAWYTAGGHTSQSYSEPLFQRHILGGIQFATGTTSANC